MHRAWKKIRTFIRSETGPTAVEYAIMIALILALCLPTVWTMGYQSRTVFMRIDSQIWRFAS